MGSGKSAVLDCFKALGATVYVADTEAKKLMATNENLIKEITQLLGDQAYINGQLNRKWIAKEVFNNPSLLTQLNNLVHPAVHRHFDNFCKLSDAPYVVYESALIIENKALHVFDLIILVTAPLHVREQRVILRDRITKKQFEDRIQYQLDDATKREQVDFIIENNTNIEELKNQVLKIHQRIINS